MFEISGILSMLSWIHECTIGEREITFLVMFEFEISGILSFLS